MKFSKITSLLLFIILTLTLMVGCRCVPSSEKWYFYSYKDEMVFLNNIKMMLGFSDASHVYPFAGVTNQNIGISFSDDGKIEFTDRDGVTHYGTFTYEHQGLNYTSFTITLENGEIIKGDSMKRNGSPRLALTYKDIIYNFITENKRSSITMDDVVSKIRDGNIESLKEAEVIKKEDGFSVKFSEIISYPIRETTAVYAIRINADGTYEILDQLYEGEALSTYNNEADYVVIYYLEK